MAVSRKTVLAIQTYQNQAELLVKNYILADSCVPYTSVLCGILACKVLIHQGLCWSYQNAEAGVEQSVSVGYFLSDLGMILWFYPSLGGFEYVLHHSLSGVAVAYSMFTGEGQLYTYMVLISEVTTPEINMRWLLDTAGMKRSRAYLINGVVIFFAWLIARILLFGYLFYHVSLHYEQVVLMHKIGFMLVFVVPSVLAVMNLMWFGKILKGLMKTLAKRQ